MKDMDMKQFKCPEKKFMPDVRWWLAEGLHTDKTLKKDLDLLNNFGFGAVEFLAMEEPGADSKIYGWGSEEWVHDSGLMFEETTKRGMGVSATCGTNWSNCNLTTITPDDRAAAKELDFVTEKLKAGENRQGKIKECKLFMPGVTKQEFVAAVSVKDLGVLDGVHYLDAQSAVILNDKIENKELTYTAPQDGNYILFYFWIHGTGQTANPSVSISYTVNYMDHYGIDAFIEYWDKEVINPKLRETIKANGRAMMYMDSLELSTFCRGGQLWGYSFIEEFRRRRGYDITPYLPFIVKQSGMMQPVFIYHYHMKDVTFEEKLYNDLYQTTTDMYMENMMKPMQEWCHKNSMELRSEISYGLPFEISQPGKYVDDVETESLEFASQIEAFRSLAGCAHIYNHVYSSETGATMLNYMMPLDFYTQIIYTQFAAGVTKTVLHGYSSIAGSDASTYWPGHEGMWPIFSERFGVRQPAFQHYNDWTGMLARYQMVLRQGKPRMDLAILRLDYNFNNMYFAGHNEKELYEHEIMRGHNGVYWKDMSLQDAGYTWDYFAPQILEESFMDYKDGTLMPDGPGYQAVIVFQKQMPLRSAEKLLSLARKGLPVIFVNGCTETIRPGGVSVTYPKAAMMTPFNDNCDDKLIKLIDEIKALPNVLEVEQQSQTKDALIKLGVRPRTEFINPNKNILTLSRIDGKNVIFYAYNMLYTETSDFTFDVAIQGKGIPYKLDCWNGEAEEVDYYNNDDAHTILTITLAPGEACLYIINADRHEVHVTSIVKEGAKDNDMNRNKTMLINASDIVRKNETEIAKLCDSGKYKIEKSDKSQKTICVTVPQKIDLNIWNLVVEDWNAGKKVEVSEDRGVGHITREVYYETVKKKINVGNTELKPWKDIPNVGPDVSGVGYYTAAFTTPDDWDDSTGAVLKISSANKNTVAVYVNNIRARAVDIDSLTVDITELVKKGANEIRIEVSSTLNNRLLQRGYYNMVEELSKKVAASANNAMTEHPDDEETERSTPELSFSISTTVQDYGLTGEITLQFYKKVEI